MLPRQFHLWLGALAVGSAGAFFASAATTQLATADPDPEGPGNAAAAHRCRELDPGPERGECVRTAAHELRERAGARPGAVGRDALAQLLGITRQQLREELAGRSLAQVAEDRGRSRDDLRRLILSTVQERLADAVAEDRLTQAEATAILDRITSRLDQILDRVHPADRDNRADRDDDGDDEDEQDDGPGRGRGEGRGNRGPR